MRAATSGKANDQFASALVTLYPRLRKRAQALVGSSAEAEDLVQETLLRAVLARTQFRYGQTPAAWVGTILQRIFFDRCRAKRRQPRLIQDLDPEREPAVEDPPERVWWHVLELDDVERVAVKLPPLLRDVFVLREIDGHGYAEIARRLGLLERTVGTRLLRARREVRRLLEREWQDRVMNRRVTPLHCTPQPRATAIAAVRAA